MAFLIPDGQEVAFGEGGTDDGLGLLESPLIEGHLPHLLGGAQTLGQREGAQHEAVHASGRSGGTGEAIVFHVSLKAMMRHDGCFSIPGPHSPRHEYTWLIDMVMIPK
jgi:hypothetical protein